MKLRILVSSMMATTVIGGSLLPTVTAQAQDWRDRESARRQKTKNDWRNLTIGSGALGLFGLLRHDNTLFFAGTAGALYSAWRYEQDRKSQSKTDRARAAYFSRTSFHRNGHRYTRKTVYKNGKKYYQF